MTTTIKITELTNIGANLVSSTVIPVVNMAGTPTTEKTVLGNIANVVLAGAGGNYVAAAKATTANTVLTNAQPNITSVGTLTSLSVTGNITSGNATLGNLATANFFSGSGNNLSNIQGGNVSGFVPNANVANTAFSVAGSNVSGAVSLATFSTIANAVAGANVAGAVGFATTANSVAAANVSGLGNIATANFDGNASNILHGDGSWSADATTYGNSNVVSLLSAFGSNTITTTGNVSVGNIIANNIGNISSINLDGNASNVLLGNGVFGGIPGSIPESIANGNSNVNIATANGNVTITSSGTRNWTFDTTGNLTTAGDLIGPANANFIIHSNASAHEFIFGSDGTLYAPDNVVLGGNSIYIGPGANTLTGIEHEVFIASSNNFAYVQAVINNVSDNGSADWVALGAKGGDIGGQASLGFTSSGFGDANYTITGNGDGYVFVQSYAPGQTLLGGGGNLVLTTGNQGTVKDIIFGTGGFLTANIFGRISHSNNSLELSRTGASLKFPDGTTQTTAYTGGGYGNSNVVTLLSAFGSNTITTTGNVSVGNIIGNGQALTGIAGANVSGFVPNANVANTAFAVAAANVSGLGNIATINLTGSNSNVLYGNGVFAPASGGGNTNTGNVTFDDVTVQGDNTQLNLSAGADFTANLAYVRVRSGDVASHIHMDTGNNEAYDLIVGDDQKFVQVSSTGNIIMSSYDGNASFTWTLDTTGNLTLPLGSVVYETNIPDGALSGSAIALKPIGGTSNNQQLLIYPTAADGDHIHMTSGNLYATELFLGSDNLYVKLANTGNVVINSNDGNSNSAMWTFGVDGNLTTSSNLVISPSGIGTGTAIAQTDAPLQIASTDANGSASIGWYGNPTGPGNVVQVALNQTGGSMTVVTGDYSDTTYIWDFDNTGNLTLPTGGNLIVSGSIVSSGASPAPTLSGFSSVSALQFTNGNSNVTVNANSNLWTFDSTGNLTIPGSSGGFIKTIANASIGVAVVDNGTNNPAQLLSMTNAGAATSIISAYATNATIQTNATGTINTWAFDSAGNLTLPGNTFSINFANGSQAALSSIANGTSNVIVASSGNVTVGVAGTSNVMTVTSTGANVTGTLNTTGNVTAQGTGSNIIRRAFGLVAADTYVTLDDLSARVTSSTNQLSLILTSGSWQGTGWTETFTGGTPTVNNWVNLPLSTGYDNASGAMNSQGNGCRCIISDQTPSAKVYQITAVRSGTTGALWNISIERLV